MRRFFAIVLIACGCGAPPVREEPRSEEREPPPRYGIALRFEEAPDEGDTPRTRVVLVRITPDGAREANELAVELGACFHEDVPGTLIAARCWWGGAGARYAIRRVDGSIIALRADAGEEIGEPREVARVEVPEDAELDVLAPGHTTPLEE